MSRRLLVAYLLLVLLPLGALAWLSARLAGAEVARANARVAELALAALRSRDGAIGAMLQERRMMARRAIDGAERSPQGLRAVARSLPFVRQPFWVGARGELLHPSLLDDLDRDEAAFLRRTASLWTNGTVLARGRKGSSAAQERASPGTAASTGWHAWHLDDGLHLISWWEEPSGSGILGFELDRVRFLSDLVAELPDTEARAPGRFRLLDGAGAVLHQWGAYRPAEGERPLVREPLSAPLQAWSLDYFGPGRVADAGVASLASGALPFISAVAVLVIGLALHVYRASTRELHEAAQRVTFVNLVSHELKTPLTNIRMYAELLQDRVEDQPEVERHAAIITAESQRLSRLIQNVLTFGKRERRELQLHRREGAVDEVVARVLESFRPSLAARGLELESELGAPERCSLDPDALEQVLGNLLSNVEKYASGGKSARVTTRRAGPQVTVSVADRGPGIPEAERSRVFEPFHRVSDALTEGVAGTGIGLTIARDLARLHGGDLTLARGGPGACFLLTIDAPEVPA